MSAALLLAGSPALALAASLAVVQEAEPPARWQVEPRVVEVGEPVRAELVARHRPGEVPSLVPSDFSDFGPSWVVLADHGRTTLTRDDPDRGPVAVSTWAWDVVSLEPGDCALPTLMVKLGGRAEFAANTELQVVGVLAEAEDLPRPPRGFRPLPPEPGTGAASWWPYALAAGVLLAGVVAWLVLRRRRAEAADEFLPLELLQALATRTGDGADAVRALHYDLSALVRAATDRRQGAARPGLTDAEWLADVRARGGLEPGRLEALEQVLRRCEPVKYGGGTPTRWAADEVVAGARDLLASTHEEPREAKPVETVEPVETRR